MTPKNVEKQIDHYVRLGLTGRGIQGIYEANRKMLNKLKKDLTKDSDWR